MRIPKEIQKQCEGCEKRTVARRLRIDIPTIVPVHMHLCASCEVFLKSIKVKAFRVQMAGSSNDNFVVVMQRAKRRKANAQVSV